MAKNNKNNKKKAKNNKNNKKKKARNNKKKKANKKSISFILKKLKKLHEKNKSKQMKAYYFKFKKKKRVKILKLFSKNGNLELTKWCYYTEYNYTKEAGIDMNLKKSYWKLLCKKNKRLPVLEWYIDQLIMEKENYDINETGFYNSCEDEYIDDACEYSDNDTTNYDSEIDDDLMDSYDEYIDDKFELLIDKALPRLYLALKINFNAFHIIAKKIGLLNNLYQIYNLLEYFGPIDDWSSGSGSGSAISENKNNKPYLMAQEVLKYDVNKFYSIGDREIVNSVYNCIYLKSDLERLKYISMNFGTILKESALDLVEHTECPICYESPIDAMIMSCQHSNCSKCFFTYLEKNEYVIICPVCRVETNELKNVTWSHIDLDFDNLPVEIHRIDNTILYIGDDNNVSVYV